MKSNKRITSAIVVAAIAFLPSIASAQSLEEIIVTAQKRAESLQDVPVAISVVSGEDLTAAGVPNLTNIDQINASITINDSTGYVLPAVRGVGSTNQGGGNYGSIAVYVDEAYVSRTTSSAFGLHNIEKVQILRGPQGSLYGRNATGGAIVVTTKTPMPGDEFTGRVSGSFGDFDLREFGFAVAGGISDTLAGSLNFASTDRDGYVASLTAGAPDLDGRDTLLVNAKLAFQPTDSSLFELGLWYDKSDDTNAHGYQQLNTTPNPALGGLNGPQALLAGFLGPRIAAALGVDAATAAGTAGAGAATITFPGTIGTVSNNNVSGFSSMPATLNGETNGQLGAYTYIADFRAVLKATFEFATFDLVSVTSYADHNYEASTDVFAATPGSVTAAFPFLAGDNLGFTGFFEIDSKAQELRLVSKESNIEWLAGVYYFEEGGTNIINADTFGLSLRQADNEWDVSSIAAFGQIKYPITDNLNLTVGARYTDEDYELTDLIGGSNGLGDVDGPIFDGITLLGLPSVQQANLGAPGSFPTEQNFSQSSGGITLDYAQDNWLVYGTWSTGFKSGNLNPNNPLSAGVDAEEITSMEIGFKMDFGAGRYRLNGAAFSYDYENIHIQVINQSSGATILLNGSNADILGAELEFLAAVTDGLTFNAGLTLLDSEYKDNIVVPNGGGLGVDTPINIAGNDVAGAPDNNLTLGVEYLQPLGDAQLIFNANALISGGYFFEAENRVGTGENGDGDSYTTVNLNLAYSTENWDIALWANNLFDEDYYRSGVVANGLIEVGIAGAPRTWGITAGYNF